MGKSKPISESLRDITIVGKVVFHSTKSTQSEGKIGVVDYKHLCLLFPVSTNVSRILAKGENNTDPSDAYIMKQHAQELVESNVHTAFLSTIADAHDLSDTDTWDVNVGFVDATGDTPAQRIMTFIPPSDYALTPEDYVLPLLTRARMHGGPFIEIEFDPASESP